MVNKKYRDAEKNFTLSKDGKPMFYNINNIIGKETAYIVEGEFDVLALYEIGIKNAISVPNGANDNDNYWINSEHKHGCGIFVAPGLQIKRNHPD